MKGMDPRLRSEEAKESDIVSKSSRMAVKQ